MDRFLRVNGRPGVWAIGDAAAIPKAGSKVAPPTAQAAVQEGRVAARNVLATIDGKEDRLEEFQYRPLGQLVELGGPNLLERVILRSPAKA